MSCCDCERCRYGRDGLAEIAALTAQRDACLAACRKFISYYDRAAAMPVGRSVSLPGKWIDQAKAAIALCASPLPQSATEQTAAPASTTGTA
jgi:hypothetical protein